MHYPRVQSILSTLLVSLWMTFPGYATSETNDLQTVYLTLQDCIDQTLRQNRDLQIERLNPLVARMALNASYGVYDPLLTSRAHQSHTADSGGFDPADLSRDAVYDADAETANASLTGSLPTGLTYAFTGSYANSGGQRNYSIFDSYSLFAGVSVSQPLLKNFWIDQNRLTIRLNKKNLRITELGVRYMTMDILKQVQQAYFELVFTREQCRIQQELLETKEKFQATVQRRVELGALSILDDKQALSQAAKTKAELITARIAVTLAENHLKTLLGDHSTNQPRRSLIPTDRLWIPWDNLSLETSWQQGLGQRPDLLQLKQDVQKACLTRNYYRNQLFPSLDLVAGYGRRGASTMQTTNLPATASLSEAISELSSAAAPNETVGLVLSVPLTLASERARYRSSKQLQAQAELRVKQKEELVICEISDAFHTARSARDRLEATRLSREYAQAALEAEEQKLARGRSAVFFVLQLQSDLAQAQTAEKRALTDCQKALAQLYWADASLLERNHIVVEMP